MNTQTSWIKFYLVLCYSIAMLTLLSACTAFGGIPLKVTESLTELDNKNTGTITGETAITAFLELPDRLSIGEKINLKFVLTNNSDTPLYVLTWYMPLEGIGGKIFRVTQEGRELPYEGILAYRRFPIPEDYVYLMPGESESAVVDLAKSYDFSSTGAYTIEFLSPQISHIAQTEADMAQTMDDLGPIQISSNTVTFQIVDS